jgi:hypothetical protein
MIRRSIHSSIIIIILSINQKKTYHQHLNQSIIHVNQSELAFLELFKFFPNSSKE